MKQLLVSAALALSLGIPTVAQAAEMHEPPTQQWSFEGIFGSYDDILNLSLEHDDDKNPSDGNWGGGWTQRTNNPFATNIQ